MAFRAYSTIEIVEYSKKQERHQAGPTRRKEFYGTTYMRWSYDAMLFWSSSRHV